MSKYNTKSEGNKPTEINEMGTMSYVLSPKETIVSRCMTTFLSGNEYYMKEKEVVNSILEDMKKVDPLFVAKLCIYARTIGNMRSVSHLLAAALAKDVSGTDWGKRFYEKTVLRVDDMSEILSAYASLNGMDLKNIKKIPNSIKRAFKRNLEKLDAYQIDKYKMKGRNVTLVDLVRLFHPKATQVNNEAYKRLLEGKSLAGLYESKIFEKEMTKAGQATVGATAEEKQTAKEEAISLVLDNVKGMPIMNLIRNLRNILLIAPNKVQDACEQLRIRNKIINSRLLPFRFATAYAEIEKLKYQKSKTTSTAIAFESDVAKNKISCSTFNKLKQDILDALEDAINISVEENIPVLGDEDSNVAILSDNSGSMFSYNDRGGSSKVSVFSKTTSADIANLFAAMVAKRQKNVYVGLFGDELISPTIDRTKGILENASDFNNQGEKCGGATESGIYDFMRQVIKEKKRVDNVIVFSDCQIGEGRGSFTPWYGTSFSDEGSHFHELFKEFRKINPHCNWVVVNIKQVKNNTVFDPKTRITNIAGWSDKIFDLISLKTRGFSTMIKEIEAIEI